MKLTKQNETFEAKPPNTLGGWSYSGTTFRLDHIRGYYLVPALESIHGLCSIRFPHSLSPLCVFVPFRCVLCTTLLVQMRQISFRVGKQWRIGGAWMKKKCDFANLRAIIGLWCELLKFLYGCKSIMVFFSIRCLWW